MPRPTFPKTLREFQSQFSSEEACQKYLASCRWPDGFVCPRCGNQSAYELVKLKRWQCTGCRHQVSVTAQTILHNTKIPLTVWFWAAYLMTTDKRGISALLLQRQLGLQRYERAWMMLHKLRRAIINLERESLRGEVEVDETWIGGTQAGLKGSRQLKGRKAALVLVAVEKRGRVTGRARMAVIPDFKRATLLAFLKENVALGSTVYRVEFSELGRPPAYDGKTALTIGPRERRVLVLPAVELGAGEKLQTVVALQYRVEEKDSGLKSKFEIK